MPDATGLELLARELRETDPDSVSDTEFFREKAALHVPPKAIRAVLEFLRGKGFRALMSVHGLDYYPEEPRLGVQYELLDMTEVDRITVKLRSKVLEDPTLGWRDRYNAVGTEELVTDPGEHPSAVNVFPFGDTSGA